MPLRTAAPTTSGCALSPPPSPPPPLPCPCPPSPCATTSATTTQMTPPTPLLLVRLRRHSHPPAAIGARAAAGLHRHAHAGHRRRVEHGPRVPRLRRQGHSPPAVQPPSASSPLSLPPLYPSARSRPLRTWWTSPATATKAPHQRLPRRCARPRRGRRFRRSLPPPRTHRRSCPSLHPCGGTSPTSSGRPGPRSRPRLRPLSRNSR